MPRTKKKSYKQMQKQDKLRKRGQNPKGETCNSSVFPSIQPAAEKQNVNNTRTETCNPSVQPSTQPAAEKQNLNNPRTETCNPSVLPPIQPATEKQNVQNPKAGTYNPSVQPSTQPAPEKQNVHNPKGETCNSSVFPSTQPAPEKQNGQNPKGETCNSSVFPSTQPAAEKQNVYNPKAGTCNPSVQPSTQPAAEKQNVNNPRTETCNPSVLPPIQPATEKQIAVCNFWPVNEVWQKQKCALLGLTLQSHLYIPHTDYLGTPSTTTPIGADGNCFYHCVSLIVTGSQQCHYQMRQLVVKYMLDHATLFRKVTPNGMTVEEYVFNSNMAQDGVWASEVELFAAAHMLKTDIVIYCKVGSVMKWLPYSGQFIQENLQRQMCNIYLHHKNENHYDVVIATKNTSVQIENMKVMNEEDRIAKLGSKNINNRTEYFRTYKKRQRENSTFKTIENEERNKSRKSRSNKNAKKEVNKKRNVARQMKRQNEDFRESENEKRNASRETKRQDEDYKISENKQRNDSRKTKRQNEDYRISENRSESVRKKGKRQDEDFRDNENKKRNASRETKRQDEDYRISENKQRNDSRKTKRQNEDYRISENRSESVRKKGKRQDEDFRDNENKKRNASRETKRQDEDYRISENKQRNDSRKTKRQNEDYRISENRSESVRKKGKRQDEDFRDNENKKRNASRETKRQDEDYRISENKQRNDSRKTKRQNEDYRISENRSESVRKKGKRQDEDYRISENKQRNASRETKRQNEGYKSGENKQRNASRKTKRQDMDYKGTENMKRNSERRTKRQTKQYRQRENLIRNKWRKDKRKNLHWKDRERNVNNNFRYKKLKERVNFNLSKLTDIMYDLLSRADDFICTVCNQTFYQHSVYHANHESYKRKGVSHDIISKCLTGTLSVNNLEWICKNCHKYVNNNKIPPMAKVNGFTFPAIPEKIKQLNPTPTEERCSALRIPFMQIKQLGVGKQYGIYGNTVNVPMYPAEVVSSLPRKMEETATIQLQFMRNTKYKRPVINETIRPRVVYELTKYFIENSELYKEEGIKLNEDWLKEIGERETDFIAQKKSNNEQTQDIGTQEDSDNEWIEITEENAPIGNRDTLLQNNDFTDDGKHALKIAPGQNNHPISLYIDEFAEEKAFPVLLAGQKRPENNIPVSYATICKAELRSADRRFASSVPNIFFKLKKLQTLQVKNSILTALRKLKGSEQRYTAKDVLDESVLQSIINQNEGYQILKSLRSSPPFFQQKQKELFATIKQLGVPTFFATFSAAETHWCDLLQILWRKSRGSEISVEEVKKLSYMEKSNLIQNEPVACARHFQYRTNLFINNIMKTSASPIGKVTDLYYRVEFHQRGSPHLHCLFWVENSPKYGESSEDDIIQFIDKYITCAKSPQTQIEDLVPLQSHRHTKTCKKKGKGNVGLVSQYLQWIQHVYCSHFLRI